MQGAPSWSSRSARQERVSATRRSSGVSTSVRASRSIGSSIPKSMLSASIVVAQKLRAAARDARRSRRYAHDASASGSIPAAVQSLSTATARRPRSSNDLATCATFQYRVLHPDRCCSRHVTRRPPLPGDGLEPLAKLRRMVECGGSRPSPPLQPGALQDRRSRATFRSIRQRPRAQARGHVFDRDTLHKEVEGKTTMSGDF